MKTLFIYFALDLAWMLAAGVLNFDHGQALLGNELLIGCMWIGSARVTCRRSQ